MFDETIVMGLIEFTVPGLPIAQPRQRTRVVAAAGRTFTQNYTPKGAPVNVFKAAVQLAAAAVYQGPPLTGPLSLTLRFYFPRAKSITWKSKPMLRLPKQGKPDWDNLGKSVCDALTGLVWQDDAQIAEVHLEKWTAAGDEQPRTEIEVKALAPPALVETA